MASGGSISPQNELHSSKNDSLSPNNKFPRQSTVVHSPASTTSSSGKQQRRNQKQLPDDFPAQVLFKDGKKSPQKLENSELKITISYGKTARKVSYEKEPADGKYHSKEQNSEPQNQSNVPQASAAKLKRDSKKKRQRRKNKQESLQNKLEDPQVLGCKKTDEIAPTTEETGIENNTVTLIKKENESKPTESENSRKDLEELGLEQAEERLKKDYILPLEKKSVPFPNAKYFCHICSHHLNDIATAHHHMKDKRHKREWKQRQQDELLKSLVLPPDDAMDYLDHYLSSILEKEVLSESQVETRKSVVNKLDKTIRKRIPGCSATIFGSSCSGFGFSTSDVNVDLEHPPTMKTPLVLIQMLKLIQDADDYENVKEDFEAKFPRIEFTDKATGLSCKLSAGNNCAVKTSQLLGLYAKMNPLVLKLGMLFRMWAKFCHLDRQTEGSLPVHAYPLMALYYMQRIHQLPVLHEIIADHDMNVILESGMASLQLTCKDSDWWYQPTPTPVNQSKKSEKKPANDNVESDSDSESGVQETIPKSRKYHKSPSYSRGYKPLVLFGQKSINPSLTLSHLWLRLLKYYAAEFDIENLIISVATSLRITRSEYGWSHKRIAIEDPYVGKWNLCKPMSSQSIFTYFMSQLKHAVKYFHESHVSPMTKRNKSDRIDEISASVVEDTIDKVCKEIGDMTINHNKYARIYRFTEKAMSGQKYPTPMCCLCKKEGHNKKSCPEELDNKKMVTLKPMTSSLENMLTSLCNEMYCRYKPSETELAQREFVVNKLRLFLTRIFSENTEIKLFGSSRNGFTFRGSDLDICMTFTTHKVGKELDFASIIKDLAKVLMKNRDLVQIIPIATAKVPIVKFTHRQTNLEGDISLYNLLAQRNTMMLSLYSEIDERCKILGYMMKAFVKLCCIGDASRGSLSSYAYTLFVIFFLQQRKPAVLPVLQELYPKGKKMPVEMVDGWNSWFYSDMGNLKTVWSDFGKNNESVGKLWHGMIKFYTEEFDFKRQVISIRQKAKLTTFEKEWTSKYICIEDPFDHSHNLGSGVSRKMTTFIMRVFRKAREHFGTEPIPKDNNFNLHNFFFDAKVLMDGQEVPNDRCCRVCGKIGHFLKDCPKRNRRRGDEGAICFHCNMKGHIKRDCPVLKTGAVTNGNDLPANGKSQNSTDENFSPTQRENKNQSNTANEPRPNPEKHSSGKKETPQPSSRNHQKADNSYKERLGKQINCRNSKQHTSNERHTPTERHTLNNGSIDRHHDLNDRSLHQNETRRIQNDGHHTQNERAPQQQVKHYAQNDHHNVQNKIHLPSMERNHPRNEKQMKQLQIPVPPEHWNHHSGYGRGPQGNHGGFMTPGNFHAGIRTLEEVENHLHQDNRRYVNNHHGYNGVSEWIGATPPRNVPHHNQMYGAGPSTYNNNQRLGMVSHNSHQYRQSPKGSKSATSIQRRGMHNMPSSSNPIHSFTFENSAIKDQGRHLHQ